MLYVLKSNTCAMYQFRSFYAKETCVAFYDEEKKNYMVKTTFGDHVAVIHKDLVGNPGEKTPFTIVGKISDNEIIDIIRAVI